MKKIISPEAFNNFVDWLIIAIVVFVLAAITFGVLGVFFAWLKDKVKNRKDRNNGKEEEKVLGYIEERRSEIISQQIVQLKDCSKNISDFCNMIETNLMGYKEVILSLKQLDINIYKSAVNVSKDVFAIETQGKGLQNVIEHFGINLKETSALYEKSANTLILLDASIGESAKKMEDSVSILDRRDKELQDEITKLLELETGTKNYTHPLLEKSIMDCELYRYTKKLLIGSLDCGTVGDMLDFALTFQRGGLLKLKGFGTATIDNIESYLNQNELIEIKGEVYVSRYKSNRSIKL